MPKHLGIYSENSDCIASATDVHFWNQRYADKEYFYGEAPSTFLITQLERLKPGMNVLVIADGEGRNGVWLAEQGMNVLSVDVSVVGLNKAKALAAERGVDISIQCADLAEWYWGNERYDAVVAIFIQFADPSLRQRIFDGICTSLKPNGVLLLQGYRDEQLNYCSGGPSEADNLYDEMLLKEAFSSELDIIHLHSNDRLLNEGIWHSGLSALIELVAIKG